MPEDLASAMGVTRDRLTTDDSADYVDLRELVEHWSALSRLDQATWLRFARLRGRACQTEAAAWHRSSLVFDQCAGELRREMDAVAPRRWRRVQLLGWVIWARPLVGLAPRDEVGAVDARSPS